MFAAGVPGRGEKGKTWRCVSPHSSTSASVFSNMASVSVGKPAMRSAPKTMSGRAARSSAQKRTASARLWRRFIRFRIMSSPGLQREMQMRHQPRLAGDGIEEFGIGLDAIDRGEPQPRKAGRRAQEWPSPAWPRLGASGEIPAIGGEIDAGQHDLAEAFGEAAPDGFENCGIGMEREAPRPRE